MSTDTLSRDLAEQAMATARRALAQTEPASLLQSADGTFVRDEFGATIAIEPDVQLHPIPKTLRPGHFLVGCALPNSRILDPGGTDYLPGLLDRMTEQADIWIFSSERGFLVAKK